MSLSNNSAAAVHKQCCLILKAVLLQSKGSAAVSGCSAAAFQRQWHHCLKAALPHCEGIGTAIDVYIQCSRPEA